jgi:hypothetical protein
MTDQSPDLARGTEQFSVEQWTPEQVREVAKHFGREPTVAELRAHFNRREAKR